jgi:DNA-directed RNA polymerase subunit RPC12/RpoP
VGLEDGMITYWCRVCEKDFEHEISYGKDIECPHCHSILSTEVDYVDVEGALELCSWVDGVIENKLEP